jgi:hypothetical protein
MKASIQKFQSIPIDIPFGCKCVVNIRVLRSTSTTTTTKRRTKTKTDYTHHKDEFLK